VSQTGKILLFVAFTAFLSSCRREDDFTDSPSAKLSFSMDTVLFDTVFTSLGGGRPASVTKQLRVYNPNKNAIRTSIRVAKSFSSFFKINIDGIPGPVVKEYEIRGKDSIFIFVQIYVDPTNSLNPFIINDSLIFETNGNIQDVQLVGWGQNAHYFNSETIACNTSWTNDKPYVIYNSVIVPEGCKLTIEEGVQIHSHVGSTFYVGGTLEVKGSKDKPVIFQGDRLEDAYKELASQWNGIRFLPKSISNKLTYAVIKNGIVGVEVDSIPVNGIENLNIQNSIIRNMSGAGLVGYTATIKAVNCLLYNIGKYVFVGELGGDYSLQHCTFSTNNNFIGRTDPSFYLSNANYEPKGGPKTPNNLSYSVINCIIYGSEEDEVELYEDGQGTITKEFRNCLVKQKKAGVVQAGNGNIFNKDPLFINFNKNDFHLGSFSPCINTGAVTSVTADFDGNARDAQPDIGCYELK
jgi:hypothetical protein